MLTSSRIHLDPNSVFLRPWEWVEVPHHEAMVRIAFLPVVAVWGGPSGQHAALLNDPAIRGLVCGPLGDTTTRLLVQANSSSMPMTVSARGAGFIKAWEKLSLTAYDANPPIKDMTIGFGHKLRKGETLTVIELSAAETLFRAGLANMESHVNKDLKVHVTQQQFDALVSLRFNTGPNAVTPPVAELNLHGRAKKEDFTKHYITSGGLPLKGLKKRRAAEWDIYSRGVYDANH